MSPANRWFVVRNDKEYGPYTEAQLKQMAASGQLRPGDRIRREDQQTLWQAGAVKGLFPAAQTSPPPVVRNVETGSESKIDKSVPLGELRRRLNSFADKIPHHDIKNLGDVITGHATSQSPVYRIKWTAYLSNVRLLSVSGPMTEV